MRWSFRYSTAGAFFFSWETTIKYQDGCNKAEKVHYFEKSIGYYRDHTLIQYEFVERIPSDEFERRIKKREMQRQQKKISERELQLILSCLKSLKEDIPEDVTELVF